MTFFDILKIFQVIVSILLILVVLVQNKNVNLNLASMSAGMNTITKRGPEKILHITTIILGAAFIISSILFFVLY